MERGTERPGGQRKGRNPTTIIIIILLAAIVVLLAVMLLKKNPEGQYAADPTATPAGGALAYDSTVVLDDPETLQSLVDQMVEKAEEGMMTLEMKTDAVSSDGLTFTCSLANALENNYDMFMTFYLDETQEEIYRTGLIPLGGRIETFTLEKALEKGTHSCTLVFNQVEEDLQTIHAQVNVGLRLIVN